MFTIIAFFQKLIKGGWNKSGEVESFQKLISGGGGGMIIQYSRVGKILKNNAYPRYIFL